MDIIGKRVNHLRPRTGHGESRTLFPSFEQDVSYIQNITKRPSNYLEKKGDKFLIFN